MCNFGSFSAPLLFHFFCFNNFAHGFHSQSLLLCWRSPVQFSREVDLGEVSQESLLQLDILWMAFLQWSRKRGSRHCWGSRALRTMLLQLLLLEKMRCLIFSRRILGRSATRVKRRSIAISLQARLCSHSTFKVFYTELLMKFL